MNWREWKIGCWLVGIFLGAYLLPLGDVRYQAAILEAFKLLQWYARNHTLACVVPALFIAGGIITFLSPHAVLRYLGPRSNKVVAYSVASVAGIFLAVCSCSVLPMFAGIYALGAGLGPAAAFLYSGPAINVLAVFLTARVLGPELGVARAVGAIGFALLVGLAMSLIFRKGERARTPTAMAPQDDVAPRRTGGQNVLLLAGMIAFLVFSDWFNPGDAVVHLRDGTVLRAVVLQEMHDEVMIQVQETAATYRAGDRVTLNKAQIVDVTQVESWVMSIYHLRWWLAGLMGLAVLLMVWRWVPREEFGTWMHNTWDFSKLLVPLLFGGVFAVGFISALLPDERVAALVGDDGVLSNLIGAVVGLLFYFATLTEVPITQALMEHGMARGPALALLLAGPALSLPSLLVLLRILGTKKTLVFSLIVVVTATMAGSMFGAWMP